MYAILGPDGYLRDVRKGKNGEQQAFHTKVFTKAKQYKTLDGALRRARQLGAAYRVIDLDGGIYV